MPWTTPSPATVTDRTPITTTWGQIVTDDLNWLNNGGPTPAAATRDNTGSLSTTSASFVDADAANLIVTVTPTGGRMTVWAWGVLAPGAGGGCIDLILDSTTRAGSTDGLFACTQRMSFCVQHTFTGLSVAAHTVKLQFRSITGGNTTTLEISTAAVGIVCGMRAWGN